MYDRIILGATIVDGTGKEAFQSDVAIEGDRIAKVGDLRNQTAKVLVDAKGWWLSPGFIDIHAHSDGKILDCPTAESRVLQGITTELAGACGMSVAPVAAERKDAFKEYMDSFLCKGPSYEWGSFDSFLRQVEEAQPSINFAMMVGHGTVRFAVMGMADRKPSDKEIRRMQQYVEQSMEEGAFGISTGLAYVPGAYADTNELVRVVAPVLPYGGFHESHMRDEGLHLLEAMKEVIDVSRATGVPLQISHFKRDSDEAPEVERALALIEQAHNEGISVSADQYPYAASSCNLASYLPDWANEGGIEKMLERIEQEDLQERIKLSLKEVFRNQWENVVISTIESSEDEWMIGKNLVEISAELKVDLPTTVLEILQRENGNVYIIHHSMSEQDVQQIMRQPYVSIGSDGWAMKTGGPAIEHPRCFCAFPRLLAKYVKENKVFSLETAIHKMTAQNAQRMGLKDRGIVKAGMKADLVLFDLLEIRDAADYLNPCRGPEGIWQVYVNGVLTVENGVHTGARAGEVLRRGVI